MSKRSQRLNRQRKMNRAPLSSPPPATEPTTEPAPLVKEIARPGVFFDMTGERVEITDELIDAIIEGTESMMARGFAVRAYSSHLTDDSKDILGRWTSLFKQNGSLFGVLEPTNQAARDLIKPLDASMVIEDDIVLEEGVVIPVGLPRIDVVGQGAVISLGDYKDIPSRMGRSIRAVCCFQNSKKGAPPMDKLLTAMVTALKLQEGATPDDIQDSLIESQGLSGATPDEQAAALSALFTRALMDPAAEAEPEGKPDANMANGEGEEKPDPAMSALQGEIEELQDDKVDAALAEVPEEDEEKAMRARFAKLRKVGGFKLAFASLSNEVRLFKRATQPREPDADSLEAFGLRRAKRPVSLSKTQRAKAERKDAGNRLVKAASRMGFRSKKGDIR